MLKIEIEKNISLKKRKKQVNLGESSKPKLIFQTRNLWNSRLELNQETQFSINLILNDEMKKNINF
jgi:hypothetical protein